MDRWSNLYAFECFILLVFLSSHEARAGERGRAESNPVSHEGQKCFGGGGARPCEVADWGGMEGDEHGGGSWLSVSK